MYMLVPAVLLTEVFGFASSQAGVTIALKVGGKRRQECACKNCEFVLSLLAFDLDGKFWKIQELLAPCKSLLFLFIYLFFETIIFVIFPPLYSSTIPNSIRYNGNNGRAYIRFSNDKQPKLSIALALPHSNCSCVLLQPSAGRRKCRSMDLWIRSGRAFQ